MLNLVLAFQMVAFPWKRIRERKPVLTVIGILLEQSGNSTARRRDGPETSRDSHGFQHWGFDQRQGTHNSPQRIA